MAALSPGELVLVLPPILVVEYQSSPNPFDWGSASIHTIDGYEYVPPDEGQLWPRGDYAPMG